MKKMRRLVLCLLAALPSASGARRAALHARGATKLTGGSAEAGKLLEADGGEGRSGTRAAISSMVGAMLEETGPKMRDILAAAGRKMDMEEAVHQLDGQLPADVVSLVRLGGGSNTHADSTLDEVSMQKARRILNDMIYDAWLELDDVIFECKEFQERNRGTYEQVVNDLARLGSQLAGLGEKRVASADGIAKYDEKRKQVQELFDAATQEFNGKRHENQVELTQRQNDLAVFDFILNLTACTSGQTLLQLDERGGGVAPPQLSICSTKDGLTLNFSNPLLQAEVEQKMTPVARLALREALGQASGPLGLAQLGIRRGRLANTTTTTTPQVQFAVEVMPVQEEPHPHGQWKKCTGEHNCGLLHDLMSLEWGKFRDQVDSLTNEMRKNKQEFDLDSKNFNNQLTVISDAKTKHMEALAEAISDINADTEEMNEKDEQKRDLTEEYDRACAEFRAKISEILYTRICAVRTVRNGLLIHSAQTPPSAISDCDTSDWESKTGECYNPSGVSILCDDTCPQEDPYKCGGKEVMKREVVTIPNSYGMKCPPLERKKRCAQKKCPVDCLMSQWSGFSKCTKECESGVQVRTRSIQVKPKNGGANCDSVQEERACNTGSCDRDCTLEDWTEWAPCSMACDTGLTERNRKVLVPIRGQGKCPGKRSRRRLQQKQCNTQSCVGDEICVAQQDLVIALDASGSLRESGFKILRGFAVNLTARYKAKYFGLDAVKMGVTLFGNGHLLTLPDGTTSITPAIQVQNLTFDHAIVRQKLAATTWQRGFTNMAQALNLADNMLTQGGRQEAQSAVLVLSDGKYSFRFQTREKARELKDKNVKVFMAPVTDFEGRELKALKRWASQPWETNYERIPGLAALQFNNEIFVQKFIVKFCPDSMSPSNQRQVEQERRYILVHENGWPSEACAPWFYENTVANMDECAMKARSRGLKAFSFGRKYAANRCYSEGITITQAFFASIEADRVDPPCPAGLWDYNPYYDTFAIDPSLTQP